MPDPLPLPRPVVLESRRVTGRPQDRPATDRPTHGLVISRSLDMVDLLAGTPADETEDDVPIVLKFASRTRLNTGPFRQLGLEALGETSDWTYYALTGSRGRTALRELVGEYATADTDWDRPATWADLLDNLTDVTLYDREDRADPDLRIGEAQQVVDVTLWPATSPAVARRRLDLALAVVLGAGASELADRVLATDPRPDTLSLRVNADAALLDDLLSLAVVERARPPLRPVVTLADIISSAQRPADPPDPDGVTIGIVDDLAITLNPLLRDVVSQQKSFPTGYVFSTPSEHGTHVSSVAAYGSLDGFAVSSPVRSPFPVAVARVLDNHGPNNTFMVGQPHVTFEEAVRWLVKTHGTRIINCSINYPHPTASGLPDLFTVAVDRLSRELSIVVVVSAGNRTVLNPPGHWYTGYPDYLNDQEARLSAPADAALAVTVGGIAHRDIPSGSGAGSGKNHTAIARRTQPSPFTRSGPVRSAGGTGKWGTSKPEFAHVAGNWAWDSAGGHLVDNDWGLSVLVAVPPSGGRYLGATTGTSVAAPAVAHELARIATRYPSAGANLLRAYLALSARHAEGHRPPATDDQALFSAYGQPDAARVLSSEGNRVLLSFEGAVKTGGAEIHRLPVPPAFVGGARHRTVRVALAFDPPVRRARREYIAGHMSVELVYGLSLAEVRDQYRKQPSLSDVEANPALTRRDLPDRDHRPVMNPLVGRLLSNTLIRRDFDGGIWQERHLDCFLVVTHDHTKSTPAQKAAYATQDYALAVELVDETNVDLDLHAAVRRRLRARARA